MKKKIRKRLHLNEFCEYGIEFDLKVSSSFSEEAFDALIDNFIEEFVNSMGLDYSFTRSVIDLWYPERKLADR